jgi:hypothetical protein
MARCGWCGTSQLQNSSTKGLESHSPSWSNRPCEGFSSWMTRPLAIARTENTPRTTSLPSHVRLEDDVIRVKFPKTATPPSSRSA